MKKCSIIAMLLAIVMIFSACGGTGASGENKQDDSQKKTVVNNCYSAGYPIAKEKVTFNVMIKDDAGMSDYTNMTINKHLEEKLNIKINWQVITQDTMVSKMTLAYASGSLPDMFVGMAPVGYSFHWKYIQQGNILKLDDYIEEYGPNIKKMFDAEPSAKYICTAPDEKIYMLPLVDYSDQEVKFNKVLYINTTWLKNLGLKKPKTTEEFAKVLRAFKTGDPNGNGQSDEIPWVMPYFEPGLLGAFGVSAYYDMYYLKNGKVEYAPIQNEYREAIIYYRNLYTEGLIDKATFNTNMLDADSVISKLANQSVATVGCFMATDSTNVLDPERANNDYEVLGPLTGPNGTCTYTNQSLEYMWPDWYLITKKCKYPEIAVRLADYFYTTEGSFTAKYGPEGDGWTMDDDGKVTIKESDDAGWRYKYTPGHTLPRYSSKDYLNALVDNTPSTTLGKVKLRDKNARIELLTPVLPSESLPQLNYTEEENAKIKALNDKVTEYMESSTESFLNNSKSIENYWDGYVANLKKFGVDELVKVKNDAYNRYAEWLKKQQ